jgi:hypothetical protein
VFKRVDKALRDPLFGKQANISRPGAAYHRHPMLSGAHASLGHTHLLRKGMASYGGMLDMGMDSDPHHINPCHSQPLLSWQYTLARRRRKPQVQG